MKKIKFPRDEKEHKNIIEWWYFNGNLKDKKGNKYSFMDCLFRADKKRVSIPFLGGTKKYIYFSHHLLSNIKKKKFYFKIIPRAMVSRDSFSKPLLFVNYTSPEKEDYTNYEIEEIDKFKYHIKSDVFDLILSSKKKPLLEGGAGFLKLAEHKSTYYYSLTNLETEGHIIVDGKIIEVKGKSWMDHQWANIKYTKENWNWFSMQLNNGVELVCFEFENNGKKDYLASIIYKNGRCEHTKKIFIKKLDKKWESKETGTEYPLCWKILIPSKKMEFEISPILKKQEMIFGIIHYWEGPIIVKGKMRGKKVTGEGFMELLGYPSKKIFWLWKKTFG